jgi:tetratricopeptide (TPR) repeat protein
MLKTEIIIVIGALVFFVGPGALFAEKELMYDPVKGIVFVEKGSETAPAPTVERQVPMVVQTVRKTKKSDNPSDIHVGRKKDPPELYFKSGLEYFRNNDFASALKNFQFADSMEQKPEYRLWIGKTYRSMGQVDDMLKTMVDLIRTDPGCDVADDALFELALHYKLTDDYDKAALLYSQLIEQYPFGVAYSTGEELREIAREQRRLMRAEMINTLTTLGYVGEDLAASYRAFQKANDLPLTEIGDQRTVRAVKDLHRKYLEQEEKKANRKARFDRYSIWFYGAGIAGVINILLLLLLLSKIKARRRHIAELTKIVEELDVKKL